MKRLKYFFAIALWLFLITAPIFVPLSKAHADTGQIQLDDVNGNSVSITITADWVNRATIHFSVNNIAINDTPDGDGHYVVLSDDAADFMNNHGGLQALTQNVHDLESGDFVHPDLLRDDNPFGDAGRQSGGFLYQKDICGGTKQLLFVRGLYWDTGANKLSVDAKSVNFKHNNSDSCGDLVFTQHMHEGYFQPNGPNEGISIGSTANRDIWFNMNADGQTLERVDNKEKFTRQDPAHYTKYQGPDVGSCSQYVILDEASLQGGDKLVKGAFETCDTDRGLIKDIRAKRDDTNTGKDKTVKNLPGGGTGQPGNTAAPPSCESNNPNVILSWLLCSVIGAVDDTMQKIVDSVDGLLDVKQDDYNQPQYKAIWSYVKNIADFLLVGAALVVIVGQAMKGE